MKKLITIALAFVLTGCGALAPAATPTAAPSSTPVVLVQTVEVTVIPTQQPTEVPTDTPAPTQTPQIVVVTATGGAAPAAAGPTNTAEANASTSGITPTATLPADVGGGMFTNFTRSGDKLSLRCPSQPDTITFGVTRTNELITQVDFYYRIEDRLSVSMSGWISAGSMVSDKQGNFTLAFKSLSVDPDVRSHKAWLDYQFVAVNHLGAAIGRSARISQQITYTIDCTD
jgi:hypothetical protein